MLRCSWNNVTKIRIVYPLFTEHNFINDCLLYTACAKKPSPCIFFPSLSPKAFGVFVAWQYLTTSQPWNSLFPLLSLSPVTQKVQQCSLWGAQMNPASLAGCGLCGHLFFLSNIIHYHCYLMLTVSLLLICWWVHVEARKQQLMVSNFHQYNQQSFCKILSSTVAQLFCKKAGDIWLQVGSLHVLWAVLLYLLFALCIKLLACIHPWPLLDWLSIFSPPFLCNSILKQFLSRNQSNEKCVFSVGLSWYLWVKKLAKKLLCLFT